MIGGTHMSCLLVIVVITAFSLTSSEIFTSSMKVERMVLGEEQLLVEFKRYIDVQYDRLKAFSNFYSDRLRDVRLRQKTDLDLSHPNTVYKVIKRFVSDYSGVLGDSFESFRVTVDKSHDQFLADTHDIRGARLSLLRLQNVYSMQAWDMARGDYLGYIGPALDAEDVFEIGQTAFTEGKLNESLEWLNVSLTLQSTRDQPPSLGPTLGAIKALIGRVHVFNGNTHLAETLYDEVQQLDPLNGDVIELEKELHTQPRLEPQPNKDYFHNFSHLCSLEKRHYPAEPTSSRLRCRYRKAVLPYYTFKEEILSVAPFASVIYDVITDEEGEHMKDFVRDKLVRGKIGSEKPTISDIRTSDLAWIYDHESTQASSISRRIECITGLDTRQRYPEAPSSSEAFQVVNYGLGGHYEVHMDPLDHKPLKSEITESGERIATFLIYLTDVERGGSTVFTRVGVSVAPTKNMALLWYSFDPAHRLDELTHHAGCPVLIGNKWIINKWIWTYGNTFRRRCGLTPDATQLDIEPDMRNGYK